MAIFGPKPWVNPFEKMSIFRLVERLVFMTQKGVFWFQNIIEYIFSGLSCVKKKVGKMAIFGPKPWANPFGKMSIFRLFKLLFFMPQKGVFSFQDITEYLFVVFIAYKKKVGKMAIFRPKPWINPFGKMSIFGLFELLVFIAQKGVFSFQNIIEYLFVVYIA